MNNFKIIVAALLLSISTISSANMTPRIPAGALMSAPDATSNQLQATQGRGKESVIYALVKANIKIWGRVGWEYGRYEALNKYGVDIGKYPGASKVTKSYIKSKI